MLMPGRPVGMATLPRHGVVQPTSRGATISPDSSAASNSGGGSRPRSGAANARPRSRPRRRWRDRRWAGSTRGTRPAPAPCTGRSQTQALARAACRTWRSSNDIMTWPPWRDASRCRRRAGWSGLRWSGWPTCHWRRNTHGGRASMASPSRFSAARGLQNGQGLGSTMSLVATLACHQPSPAKASRER